MPRINDLAMTETVVCETCSGSGHNDVNEVCSTCGGNGYAPADELPEQQSAGSFNFVDLTNATPTPGRMANQTWRILEEQRLAADETIRECEVEIERWTNKMVDAMKTKRGCEAGQAALDGGL